MTATVPIATPVITPILIPNNNRPRPAHWNNIKPAWDNGGYCWTHGHKVKVDHISSTCTLRKARHQAGATHNNTLGGSTFNTGYPKPPT